MGSVNSSMLCIRALVWVHAMSTIPLAKPYNEAKIEYPGYLSVKLDGVPIRYDVSIGQDGVHVSMRTRQGKESVSTQDQFYLMLSSLMEAGVLKSGNHTFIAEVTHKTYKDFKDAAGVVRRQEPQEDLVLNVFDFYPQDSNATFEERLAVLLYMMQHVHSEAFKVIPQLRVDDPEQFKVVQEYLLDRFPTCEGLIYRAANAGFNPGKREWSYQKILIKPTADLRIVGMLEGKGKNANAAGRLIAEYKGQHIGIGPGKLNYAERAALWDTYKELLDSNGIIVADVNLIAQVEYKRDPSYEALREPTFQHWRPDKEEPNYE